LVPEQEEEIKKIFADLNFPLKQFWVPSSSWYMSDSPYPGWIDVLAPKELIVPLWQKNL